MSDYNGWTNYETWLVNVHFNPETTADVDMIREMVEDEIDAVENSFLKGLLNSADINWMELTEAFEESDEEND